MRKTRAGSMATCFLAACLVFNLGVVPPAMAEAQGSGASDAQGLAPEAGEAGHEAEAKPATGGGVAV